VVRNVLTHLSEENSLSKMVLYIKHTEITPTNHSITIQPLGSNDCPIWSHSLNMHCAIVTFEQVPVKRLSTDI
jgi:hypothetical protein